MAYSQNDPAWKNDFLGNTTEPGDTVGNYGCYLTSISNVCAYAGRDLNPGEVNGICRDNGWFTNDLINRDDIPALLCDNLQFVGRTNWTKKTDLSFFSDASDPNVAYIIMIDAYPAAGLQTHFVMVWATSGTNDLIIDDSWDGVRKKLSHYGDPSTVIYSAIKFVKKQPPAPTPEPQPEPTPVEAPMPEPTPAPVAVPDPLPDPVPVPDTGTVVDPTPEPTPAPQPAPVKVVVPEPSEYYKVWELIAAILKRLFNIMKG